MVAALDRSGENMSENPSGAVWGRELGDGGGDNVLPRLENMVDACFSFSEGTSSWEQRVVSTTLAGTAVNPA